MQTSSDCPVIKLREPPPLGTRGTSHTTEGKQHARVYILGKNKAEDRWVSVPPPLASTEKAMEVEEKTLLERFGLKNNRVYANAVRLHGGGELDRLNRAISDEHERLRKRRRVEIKEMQKVGVKGKEQLNEEATVVGHVPGLGISFGASISFASAVRDAPDVVQKRMRLSREICELQADRDDGIRTVGHGFGGSEHSDRVRDGDGARTVEVDGGQASFQVQQDEPEPYNFYNPADNPLPSPGSQATTNEVTETDPVNVEGNENWAESGENYQDRGDTMQGNNRRRFERRVTAQTLKDELCFAICSLLRELRLSIQRDSESVHGFAVSTSRVNGNRVGVSLVSPQEGSSLQSLVVFVEMPLSIHSSRISCACVRFAVTRPAGNAYYIATDNDISCFCSCQQVAEEDFCQHVLMLAESAPIRNEIRFALSLPIPIDGLRD